MTAAANKYLVSGDDALAAFRQGLTGAAILGLHEQADGRLLVQLPVGVGKTQLLVDTAIEALNGGRFDLIVVMVPRWDVLRELLDRFPADIPHVVLKPRPAKRCGLLDDEWSRFEQNGCGHLARQELCAACPRRKGCFWPSQFGEKLWGARLVFATQQHLVTNRDFIQKLAGHTGTRCPLVLIDESNLLLRPTNQLILGEDLEHFITAQEEALRRTGDAGRDASTWLEMTRLLTQTTTSDLREGDWRFPWVAAPWALAVQQAGHQRFGHEFQFLGYALRALGTSDRAGREVVDGGVRFAAPPYVGDHFIIFSGSIAKELVRYRLDPNHSGKPLASPFESLAFEHPNTRWFNICSVEGAECNFRGNSTRILDFFAAKTVDNICNGKRTLLVVRKSFKDQCRTYLQSRLRDLGAAGAKVVAGNWNRYDLSSPAVVPIITYGVCGLNLFENYDAAYCLSGFYVSSGAVESVVHDVDATDAGFTIHINMTGNPRRRRAIVVPDATASILPTIAHLTLVQLEADTVVQAVGRVRPFTKPREIITFHAGHLPGVRFSHEFRNLHEARAFFRIETRKQAQAVTRAERIRVLRQSGMKIEDIARAERVSKATVKRAMKGS